MSNKFTSYLESASAFVFTNSQSIISPATSTSAVSVNGIPDSVKVVNWGDDNKLPAVLREKVGKSPDMGAGMLFNIQLSYGEGILPIRYELDDNKKRIPVPVYDNSLINDFFEQNQVNPKYLLEQVTDMNWFFNVFPEIIVDNQGSKIVELHSKEAEFSRLSEMNSKAVIEWHLYSAKWGDSPKSDEIVPTRYLNPSRPLFDLKERVKGRDRRFIVPVSFPTPGATYYQKPYWYSLIESGWYDFAIAIPEFKKALLKNGMAIKFLIEIDEKYWDLIFSREGITTEEDKLTRVKKELEDLNKFLVGEKNAGKGWIAPTRYQDGSPEARRYIRITEIKADFKGGEYLQDASDVSNIIAYAMGVHSGLIGSSPGKNSGSLSGTDKREMFIIKQALMKPFRDLLLMPFYLIKQFNNWPKDVFFSIPNMVLTTLDSGTGSQKVIS